MAHPSIFVGDGKTKTGREREADLDAPTIATLRSWRARQAQERLLLGAGYEDNDLVFLPPRWSAVPPGAREQGV